MNANFQNERNQFFYRTIEKNELNGSLMNDERTKWKNPNAAISSIYAIVIGNKNLYYAISGLKVIHLYKLLHQSLEIIFGLDLKKRDISDTELDRRNVWDNTGTTLKRSISSRYDFTHKGTANVSGYISEIENIFVLLNRCSKTGVMIKNM